MDKKDKIIDLVTQGNAIFKEVLQEVKTMNDESGIDRVCDVSQAATILGCSNSNIYQLSRTGKLHKLAMKGVMFSYNELKAYREGLKK